jgi:hypothetical protein
MELLPEDHRWVGGTTKSDLSIGYEQQTGTAFHPIEFLSTMEWWHCMTFSMSSGSHADAGYVHIAIMDCFAVAAVTICS